jgi:hypothetical protein
MKTRAFSLVRALLVLAVAALLAACGSTPPPPWQMNAKSGLERAQRASLTGLSTIERAEMTRVRRELARTGRADLMARAELGLCATRVAALDFSPCLGFEKLAPDATETERAYARYLLGEMLPGDVVWLPQAHRPLAGGGDGARRALPSMEDPLSRLVAAGVLMRQGQASPEVVALAVETASLQGWSRPLLAWLGVQRERARAAGDQHQVDQIQRRMDLILGEPR